MPDSFPGKATTTANAADENHGSGPCPTTVLGRTGLHVSRIAFGAGPVSGLMTGDDVDAQASTLKAALMAGINWIDTAAGYGAGSSERNLGAALRLLSTESSDVAQLVRQTHVATKVRIDIESHESFRSQVERSLAASLERLQRESVTLLQLHNGITARSSDEPASVTPEQVLADDGILAAMHHVQQQSLTRFIGLTGTGQAASLKAVVDCGQFDTLQVPYNILNPSAGVTTSTGVSQSAAIERDYGNVLSVCARHQMGAFAIRVLAAGAILGNAASPHTLKTPYFPLSLYESDALQAASLREELLARGESAAHHAIRFALAHPHIHAAIIGFGNATHVREAVQSL